MEKCENATKIALGHNGIFSPPFTKVVASTLLEVEKLVGLAHTSPPMVTEIVYGMPLRASNALDRLDVVRKLMYKDYSPDSEPNTGAKIIIFVDNLAHVDIIESFAQKQREQYPLACHHMPSKTPNFDPFDVFIKLDSGYGRAGVDITTTEGLEDVAKLAHRVQNSFATRLYGLYSHSGHSYASSSAEEAQQVMTEEVAHLIRAAKAVSPPITSLPSSSISLHNTLDSSCNEDRPLVLSFGATPQAHVISALADQLIRQAKEECGSRQWKPELHAGNFIVKDLQQVSTGCCHLEDQAMRLVAEVCSVYPRRNEVLINAGRLALSSETSPAFPGYGTLAGKMMGIFSDGSTKETDREMKAPERWYVKRISQEHGILALKNGEEGRVEEEFQLGEKVLLWVNHACITAALHQNYLVVDKEDVVQEVWQSWEGW